MAASAAMSAPYKIYWEVTWYQSHGATAGAGNPMAHGQQLIDGGSIIASGNGGVMLYADEQKFTAPNGVPTAFIKGTPGFAYHFDPAEPGFPVGHDYATKGGCMLNGRIYAQSNNGAQIHQSLLPTWTATPVGFDGPWGPGMATGRDTSADNDANGLVTDGACLYGSISGDGGSSIYKWSVDPAGNDGTGTLTQVWKTDIATSKWFMCIGYYNGKIYALENYGANRTIYEIDCATGVATDILTPGNYLPDGNDNGWVMGQVARCGNRIVAAAWSGHITQWQLIGSTWTLVSNDGGLTNEGYPAYFIGLSLKPGPDGNARYAWASGANIVYFWDLTPFTGTPANLSAPRKSGYPVYVDAVVTAQGPAGTFWVENPERTRAEQVLYTGPMPAIGKVVTLKVTSSTNAAGEKVLTAINDTDAVTVGATADPEVKPVYVTNKSMGLATGGAGLANDGMLVKISGKVIGPTVDSAGFFIDDGSGVPTGLATPDKGVKVLLADGLFMDAVANIEMVFGGTPCTAVITGIVRLEVIDGKIVRRIDARSIADIVIEAL